MNKCHAGYVDLRRTLGKSLRLALLLIAAPFMAMPLEALAINTPQDVRGTEIAPNIIKWEWARVDGATVYEAKVDGKVAGLTFENQFYTRGSWIGQHSFTVKAAGPDSRFSIQSATANVTTTGVVGNPNGAAPPAQRSGNDTGMVDPTSRSQPGVAEVENAGYELTFSDEFNGNSLNTNRWNSAMRWDGEWNGERYEYRVVNGERQLYVDPYSPDDAHRSKLGGVHNPFEFNGQRLAIRSIKNPLKNNNQRLLYGNLDQIASQQEFLSGTITTADKFAQKYGRFEARIKIAGQTGSYPAFWLHHQRRSFEGTQRTEIDILENLGHNPQYIYNTFHYFTGVSRGVTGQPNLIKPLPSGQIYTGTDYSQDYHVYGVEWSPGYAAWFIDGQKVSEVWNPNLNHEELYIILNQAVGSTWTNYPANAGGLGRPGDQFFPNQNDLDNFGNPALEIDWVRAYRRR